MRTWSANSIENGQNAGMCRIDCWFYNVGKVLSFSVPAGQELTYKSFQQTMGDNQKKCSEIISQQSVGFCLFLTINL